MWFCVTFEKGGREICGRIGRIIGLEKLKRNANASPMVGPNLKSTLFGRDSSHGAVVELQAACIMSWTIVEAKLRHLR